MSSPQQPSPPPSALSATSLARGTACLPCRRRKMRCDGGKPVCGPCVAKDRQEDCEYTGDIQGLTRTQLLEENISLLEARIRDLENPSEASSIKLRDAPGTSNAPVALTAPGPSNIAHSERVAGPSAARPQAGPPEPTMQDVQNLLNAFIPHATRLGFFLHVPRFVQAASLPPGARDPLVEPLLTAVCLWGSRLARGTPLAAFEDTLLAQAVQGVSAALFLASAGERGHALLGAVQAEVLLAHYFFALGRFLEGRYHGGAAASLALTCRLHALGPPAPPGPGAGPAPGQALPAPRDAVEHGERVDAFWTVYVLDQCWSGALGAAPALAPGGAAHRIATLWPLAPAQYAQGVRAPHTGVPAVAQFLAGHAPGDLEHLAPLALRAQAATLFAQASALAARYSDDMPDKPVFWHEFAALDGLVRGFVERFPQVPPALQGDALERLVARTVAHGAVIQLHIRFAKEQAGSHDACLAAANAVLAGVQGVGPQLGYIDPIMAILLSSVCQVFLGELKAFGAVYDEAYVAGIRASLDRVVRIMESLGDVCPLMAIQVRQVREAQAVS
ncbi:C6 transcription factor domain-containing protein [Phanerochaete sordida]|uniref:C6 transcription factor domain-containing protein n=1 Tax=Phanerochaete sordida TaxID=48140 RepID=A0A9P3GMP3_9APHY|nr:C6 transcription factor domain-containing protein [Phanerochaete sordida]